MQVQLFTKEDIDQLTASIIEAVKTVVLQELNPQRQQKVYSKLPNI